jgi:hypothetical protein
VSSLLSGLARKRLVRVKVSNINVQLQNALRVFFVGQYLIDSITRFIKNGQW